ncbi:MAG: hypothetical protein H6729_04195 [Deltaproteobacteria bacterium]|nr:hypothetical protein [Deltaproteobacteria bacterium]
MGEDGRILDGGLVEVLRSALIGRASILDEIIGGRPWNVAPVMRAQLKRYSTTTEPEASLRTG